MKIPKPKPPSNAPEGTVWFGGPIGWFRISFGITSDDLDPTDVTSIFGVEPDHFQKKGVPLFRTDGTVKRIPKFGGWVVEITPQDTDEWDIEEAAMLLMSRLPSQIEVWRKLPEEAVRCLSFGLYLKSMNQEFSLAPDLTRFASERNIQLDFDVYVKDDEIDSQ